MTEHTQPGTPQEWVPQVDVHLLVRRPAEQVWEAFADPAQLTRFWLAHSSGRLVRGAEVHWAFKVAGAETDVRVLAAEPGRLLDLRWDDDQPLRITFEPRGGDTTLVRVRVTDFTGDQPAAKAAESMSGSCWCSPRSSSTWSTASPAT